MPEEPPSSTKPSFAMIRAATLLRFLEGLDLTDRRIQALLRRHGLANMQRVDPYTEVPLADYIGFLEEAAEFTGDPLLGARG